jgi:hypothetical protein
MINVSCSAEKFVRWTARIISTLAASFWLLILLDVVVCDALVGFICLDWEMALLVLIVAAAILSVILSWHKEGIGGFVMLLWGIIFTTFSAIDNQAYWAVSMLVSGVPFLVAGFLFLVTWCLSLRAVQGQ